MGFDAAVEGALFWLTAGVAVDTFEASGATGVLLHAPRKIETNTARGRPSRLKDCIALLLLM